MSVQKILNRENRTIVYEYEPKPQKACIVYLHGLNSSRQSKKGKRLLKLAKEKNYAFLSVDYTAHGESEGTPADFRIARCLNDVLDVMDKEKIVNPLYLVGSSLGGWIAFLLAEKMQNQVKGILTCAAGVDFLERVWRKMLPSGIKLLLKSGHIIGPNAETKGYCFSYAMFQEAKPYLLLHRKINYTGPVILAHGDADTVVLPDNSFKIKEALLSQDVQVHIIKGEGHALSGYPLEQEVERLIWKGEKMVTQKNESIYVKAGRLFFILLFVYAVCFVSSLFITPDRLNWYRSLPLSALTPPDYLFGVAWSILYLLMGISAFLVWNKASPRYFALQLICAGLWPFVFFFLHSIIGGLIIIGFMIVFLALTVKTFYPVSKTAAFLLIPQLVWAVFAFYLNASLLIG